MNTNTIQINGYSYSAVPVNFNFMDFLGPNGLTLPIKENQLLYGNISVTGEHVQPFMLGNQRKKLHVFGFDYIITDRNRKIENALFNQAHVDESLMFESWSSYMPMDEGFPYMSVIFDGLKLTAKEDFLFHDGNFENGDSGLS
ncbi:hypothetical protein C7447_102245 [Tenacibaculum adriaticum]|uniref:Uncharacterized protein n=1 Tax=Tenacibaculum adriaticum TaxID=413713 RepID=A0A5S5DSS0_9FLAO|nr:hypothetical protein [Tenacibaculum adriaticum]TYP98927.1 hypothetical protein C7447_102245 [Tenacibaculum adriaticum]